MNNRGSFLSSIPPVTLNLLIINFIMWLATIALDKMGVDLFKYLGLHFWQASDFNPAQLFTYMFLHDASSITHLFFNMFSLWMFGVTLERVLGAKRYLFYYVTCGLGAALIQELTWQFTWQNTLVTALAEGNALTPDQVKAAMLNGQIPSELIDRFVNSMVTVGASGAVFGILLAFGMLFPNMQMYIIPIPVPIKAKWMVIGYGAIELFFGLHGVMSGVAHFAHLGGMIAGFFVILYWKYTGTIGKGNGFY
ncbi:MAG: rhomboid family intramembrane serine protease [Muribaculaceae bacterium]|nr:rhomboid family intramembrane serine protease [Muribaculaceae bacterium]